MALNEYGALHPAAQQGFEKEAQAYARGRPDYPQALSDWLQSPVGAGPGRQVADVGAGTGKFTALLARTGAQVTAVEPVDAMRAQIAALQLDGVRALPGTAQALPFADGALDAVVCAQAFHWFASREALDEFHRVLRPGGRLALVWNVRDESVDWVAAGFGPLLEERFAHAHAGPPQQVIVDRFMSVSFIAALPEVQRDAVRRDIETLVATHPALRGQDTVRFPYTTLAFHCVRH